MLAVFSVLACALCLVQSNGLSYFNLANDYVDTAKIRSVQTNEVRLNCCSELFFKCPHYPQFVHHVSEKKPVHFFVFFLLELRQISTNFNKFWYR